MEKTAASHDAHIVLDVATVLKQPKKAAVRTFSACGSARFAGLTSTLPCRGALEVPCALHTKVTKYFQELFILCGRYQIGACPKW